MPATPEQREEWLAWRRVVREWERLRARRRSSLPDFNSGEATRFVAAVELHAEATHALRAQYSSAQSESAEDARRLKYERACAESGDPPIDLDWDAERADAARAAPGEAPPPPRAGPRARTTEGRA